MLLHHVPQMTTMLTLLELGVAQQARVEERRRQYRYLARSRRWQHLTCYSTSATEISCGYAISIGNRSRQRQAADAEIPNDLNEVSLICLRYALLHIAEDVLDRMEVQRKRDYDPVVGS